jgi:2-methylisocitrate lyase-like PEP mutase family enzyme
VRDLLPSALGGAASPGHRRQLLRQLLDDERPTVLPGIFDALTAVVAERAGFECLYLTGAGLANTQLAVPDVGLTSLDTLVTQSVRIVGATGTPLIVDIDAGFGGPTSVMHVVRTLESVGVSAVQLEDQTMPKRCGHFARKSVVSTAEMQRKIDAATHARSDPGLVIIARTDALAVEGFDASIARARAYAAAGADVLFVEAPTDLEQVRRIPELLPDQPLLINVVEGGKTPVLSAAEFGQLGYRLILHANVLMRAMVRAAEQTLTGLRESGHTQQLAVPFISWEERQRLVRLDDFDRLEDEFTRKWPELP